MVIVSLPSIDRSAVTPLPTEAVRATRNVAVSPLWAGASDFFSAARERRLPGRASVFWFRWLVQPPLQLIGAHFGQFSRVQRRALAEDCCPHPDQGCALLNSDRKIVSHSHRQMRKLKTEFLLQRIAK